MAGTKGATKPQASTTIDFRTALINIITEKVKSHFPKLNTINGIVPIFMALIGKESSYNIYANHKIIPESKSSLVRSYYKQPQISSLRYNNLRNSYLSDGARAWSLTGVMGCNHIRGTDLGTKGGLASGRYSGIASSYGLLVEPGYSIGAVYSGSQVQVAARSVVAGLIMLEQKLIAAGNIRGALSSYLGNGVDVITGLSSDQYANDILGAASNRKPVSSNGVLYPSAKYGMPVDRSDPDYKILDAPIQVPGC